MDGMFDLIRLSTEIECENMNVFTATMFCLVYHSTEIVNGNVIK